MNATSGVRSASAECRVIRHALCCSLSSRCRALVPGIAIAQNRVYRPNLADEDWSFLKDPAKRIDWWDPVKYIPLGEHDDWYMTLSGEIRFRPEGFRIRPTDTGARNSRSVPAATVPVRSGLSISAPGRGSMSRCRAASSTAGSARRVRPTQTLRSASGFRRVEDRAQARSGFDVRLGRQELDIGSSRLISAAPGLNVKRSFDGVRVVTRRGAGASMAPAPC